MRLALRLLLVLALASLLAAPAARADVAVTTSAGNEGNIGVPATVGWSFRVATPGLRVTDLGLYDSPAVGPGLVNPHTIAIWDAAAPSTALTSAVISGPGTSSVGSYKYVPVTPIILQAGRTYVIGATYGNNDPDRIIALPTANVATDSRVQITGGRRGYSFTAPTLVYPNEAIGSVYLGPNFQFTAVPEPSPLLLLGLTAVTGGAWAGVRRARRRPSPAR